MCVGPGSQSSPFSPHHKKSVLIFPSPAGMSLSKLSLGGNNDVIYKLFPLRESLVSDIPAGGGNIEKLFLLSTHYRYSGRSNSFLCVLYIWWLSYYAKSGTSHLYDDTSTPKSVAPPAMNLDDTYWSRILYSVHVHMVKLRGCPLTVTPAYTSTNTEV